MNQDQQREEDIYYEASRMEDLQARARYLTQACGGDDALRRRVEDLLDASRAADLFFDKAVPSLDFSESGLSDSERVARATNAGSYAIEDFPDARIGRYKLLEKIGEGGCGLVYLAEQEEPVQRRVALKIIRRGMESRTVIARFEAERQALAIMDHPNIARVFDAGETELGSPYFVMELVRGIKITDYCNQNRYDIRQCLELFIQVCHAIQHAHQKGIIHRDIKPANIVVAMHDGVPVPKVIDFGIARSMEHRPSEKGGNGADAQLIGTPAYMSPEQFELGWMDIDTRSDIYSLGVLLFELLTGTTPFDTKAMLKPGLDEFRKSLRTTETPRASVKLDSLSAVQRQEAAARRHTTSARLFSALHADLDWVLLKALQKDRSLRYETANALAMDLQRYLDSEAVTARPTSWFYQGQKLVRRNRALFAALGAITATLVIGLGTSTWLFLKEREARQRAVAAEQQQFRLRYEAEVREKVAQVALLVSLDRFQEADALLGGITLTEPTVEGSAVYRSLGEWHALHNRPKLASDRFTQLLRLNQLDGWDVTTLDALRLGPALLDMGDLNGYERFRTDIVARYSGAPPQASDRIIKICMLKPVDQRLISGLRPLVEQNKRSILEADAGGDAFQSAWRCLSQSLWEYRLGNHVAAQEWAGRCVASPDYNAPRLAAAHAVLACAKHQQGRRGEAREDHLRAVEIVDTKYRNRLDRGTPVLGFWFDWAFARIMLRESAALVEENSEF